MPSCALTDNNSDPNELRADESLIAGEKKIKNELIESLNKAYSLGRVWLGRREGWGSNGRFEKMVLMVRLRNTFLLYASLGQSICHTIAKSPAS